MKEIMDLKYNHLFYESVLEFVYERNSKDPEWRNEHIDRYGNYNFNKELNTLYLKMPRQCGNTSLSVSLGETLSNSCFILSKDKYVRDFQNKHRIINVFSPGFDFYRLKKFDYVIVENYSIFDGSFIDRLWHELNPNLFLFIG